MLDRLWKGGLTSFAAFAAAFLGLAALLGWVAKRRRRRGAVLHILRLACEVIDVASTIEEDLESAPKDGAFGNLRSRCREFRDRAEATLAQTEKLRRLATERVDSALELLHDDHRRVVNLRSEADAALAAWRDGRSLDAARACKFATGSKPQRSRWPSSGFHTRPSTLI